jgi:hypothetical protein
VGAWLQRYLGKDDVSVLVDVDSVAAWGWLGVRARAGVTAGIALVARVVACAWVGLACVLAILTIYRLLCGRAVSDVYGLLWGRDVSVVSNHEASLNPVVRSIINADSGVDATATNVKFSLKPHKVFLFDTETEERIPFEVK